MNKTKNSLLVATFLVLTFALASGPVCHGAETVSPQKMESVVVATVEIFKPSSEKMENGDWKVSFDLFNEKGVQGGIKYAVELQKINEKEKKIETVDRRVSSEAIVLGENQTVHREMIYAAPLFLQGDYQIGITAENGKGLVLATATAGKATLNGTGQSIKIDKNSCIVLLSGETKSQKLTEFSTVSPEQKMTLQCSVTSLFDREVAVWPTIKTNRFSAFGELVGEAKGEKLVFPKGSSHSFEVEIPKGAEPSGYAFNLTLEDEQGNIVSNALNFRFSVSGAKATILNLISDKSAYARGETANVSFFWTSPSKPGKITAEISLISGQTSCTDPFQKEIGADRSGGMETVALSIVADCPSGKLAVGLKDENGKTLDGIENEAPVPVPTLAQEMVPAKRGIPLPYAVATIILLVGIGLIVWQKKNTPPASLLLLFFLASAFWGLGAMRAEAAAICSADGAVCDTSRLADDQQPNYCDHDWINFYQHFYRNPGWCLAKATGGDVVVTGTNLKSPNYWRLYEGWSWDENYSCSDDYDSHAYINFPVGHPVGIPEDATGTYVADFWEDLAYRDPNVTIDSLRYATLDRKINFSVSNAYCHIDGACGLAQGGVYESAPATDLCSSGNASNPILVPVLDRWRWTCSGSNGGSAATCWARHDAAVNSAPEAHITSPANGAQFNLGEAVPFSGYGTDIDGDPISAYAWAIDGDPADPNQPQAANTPSFSRSNLSVGTHTAYFWLADASAASAKVSVTFTIQSVVCVPSGSNIYACPKSAPVCDQNNCNRDVSGSVSCSFTNNCGTFVGTISGGMCGNVRCVADSTYCDCAKWREVAP